MLVLLGCGGSDPSEPAVDGAIAIDAVPAIDAAPAVDTAIDAPAGDAIPLQSGAYLGHYRVPVSAELEAAASFAVPQVDWTVAGGVATLHYDLPVGLVGGLLDVSFSGPATPGATQLVLNGTDGVGTCTATATAITCHEVFANLGPLPISVALVESTAATEYAGPASDRTAVAMKFGSDPIGFVDFDITHPVDDGGGGGGGGGGGNP